MDSYVEEIGRKLVVTCFQHVDGVATWLQIMTSQNSQKTALLA